MPIHTNNIHGICLKFIFWNILPKQNLAKDDSLGLKNMSEDGKQLLEDFLCACYVIIKNQSCMLEFADWRQIVARHDHLNKVLCTSYVCCGVFWANWTFHLQFLIRIPNPYFSHAWLWWLSKNLTSFDNYDVRPYLFSYQNLTSFDKDFMT